MKTFHKKDNPRAGHLPTGEVVEVQWNSGSIIAVIGRHAYAMNGLGCHNKTAGGNIIRGQGKSVASISRRRSDEKGYAC